MLRLLLLARPTVVWELTILIDSVGNGTFGCIQDSTVCGLCCLLVLLKMQHTISARDRCGRRAGREATTWLVSLLFCSAVSDSHRRDSPPEPTWLYSTITIALAQFVTTDMNETDAFNLNVCLTSVPPVLYIWYMLTHNPKFAKWRALTGKSQTCLWPIINIYSIDWQLVTLHFRDVESINYLLQ